MANVDVTVQTIVPAGVAQTYEAMSASDVYLIPNDGNVFLHIKKTGLNLAAIAIATPGTVEGLVLADETFSVQATTGDKMAGPFHPSLFNNAAGQLSVTTTEGTSLTLAALRFGG